ncbi:MAG TPA: recombinase family protein, partial [Candidatus Woesebacteria bacterium]|nr:recombinase family protein [Candidatus Woesebacteria bacterium]
DYIKKAFETYTKGGFTIKAITERLNRMGMRTEKNKKITPQYLIKIFNNKLYMGVVSAWGEEHTAVHEPLISKDLFYTVEAIRLGKSIQISVPHATNNPKFPLKKYFEMLSMQ